MAKLKGLKKINKIINDFTKENFGVRANLDKEFLAYCRAKRIGYTLAVETEDINFFLEDAQARFPEVHADPFLWFLMHEVGHCMTDNTWTEAEKERINCKKSELSEVEDDQLRNDLYHTCPDEYFATRWAGQWMTKHQKKIAKFWNKIQPAIMEFYKKNGLLEV